MTEKTDVMFTIRMTKEEAFIIKNMAQLSGLSINIFCVKMLVETAKSEAFRNKLSSSQKSYLDECFQMVKEKRNECRNYRDLYEMEKSNSGRENGRSQENYK